MELESKRTYIEFLKNNYVFTNKISGVMIIARRAPVRIPSYESLAEIFHFHYSIQQILQKVN